MPKKPLPTPEEFVAVLRAYIARRGVSQREAAEALGVQLRTLETWLGGSRKPSPMAVRALTPLLKQ